MEIAAGRHDEINDSALCHLGRCSAVARDAGAQNKCQALKIQDAGKKAACIAALQAKFVGKGTPIDPTKLAKCNAKVTDAYAKLEAKGGCNTTNDAATIEGQVDTFVDGLVSALDVGPSNCPEAPCTTYGGSCSGNGDCCSNNCELSGSPPFCGVSLGAGGCCQSADDCSFPTTCTAGRCACLPSGGAICGSNADCCSHNCPMPTLSSCQ